MNCKYNFPSTEITVEKDDDEDKYYGGNITSTRIMQLFRDVSLDDLAESFENSIMKLFSEDKKSALIGALKYVIANDESLHSNSKQTFENCMGMSLEQAESDHVEVILPRFLAGIFLYTLFTNDNKQKTGQMLVKKIGKPEFWNQFETYRITYTNECVKGFVPAPDDFGAYLEHLGNKHSSITTLICILFPERSVWEYNEKEKKLSRNMLFQILDRYALELKHSVSANCYYIMKMDDCESMKPQGL